MSSQDSTENPRLVDLAFHARRVSYEAERLLVMRQNGQPDEAELRDFLFRTMILLKLIASEIAATVKPEENT